MEEAVKAPDFEPEYIASFKNVSFSYNKKGPYETKALREVNLNIKKGCITGIIGATGSGKSTLVQMLNGLLKPDEGELTVDGFDLCDKKTKLKDLRFKVGLVMQYPEYQLFDETVYDDISFGPKNMGLTGEELGQRVLEAADFSGLDRTLLKKSPFDLSGGQKRRAALAGVIAMRPDVLVLDEPAAGLDPVGRREILGRIREYQRESGISIVIVSHSMEDMAKYCDRLVVLKKGQVVLNDKTENVFSSYSVLRDAALDVPKVTKIAAELKGLGIDIGDDIYTVKYAAEKIIEKYGLNQSTN